MANGEKTQQFILSIIDGVTSTVTDKLTNHVEEVKTTAKYAVLIDQIERVGMVVVIIGAVWWIFKKNKG